VDPRKGDEFDERLQRLAEAQQIARGYADHLRRKALVSALIALGCIAVMLGAWWLATWESPAPANPTVIVVPARR